MDLSLAFNVGMLHFKKQKVLKRHDPFQDTIRDKRHDSYETRELLKVMSEITQESVSFTARS